MKHVKITNILLPGGDIDYKGLDITKFYRGSQNYSDDLSFCILTTTEENLPLSNDVVEITQNEYDILNNEIENSKPENELLTLKSKVTLLQNALDDILMGGM